MDISIADTKVLKFPVEAKLPNQIVFLLDITCGCWRGRVARTYAEIEEFHVFLSSKIKKNEIPAFPAFDTPDVLKTSLVEYFNALAAIGDAEVYVQDILIGYSTYSSQFFKTEEPIIKEGYLALKVDKNYRNFWFVLQGNVLSYFNQRTEAGETVKLPVGSIELQGAKLGKKDDKMFQIATDVGPNEIRAVSSDVRQDWLNTLKDVISASSADISISKELTPQQLKSVSLLRESLGAEYDDLSDAHLVRFLREKLWNVDLSASLIRADRVWRQDVGVERLNILGVYDAIKTGKLYFPGTFDKKGRAIVVFKAKAHDINSDFLETMKLIIYICERAIEAMTDADEVLLIEDLSGFERDQFDARMIKLALEMVMAHYPSRIGLFVACSSPWYYRLIFKVIRPWLTPDLNSKVHIYGGTEELLNFANKDQLPVELGGTKKFNLNDWIQERARIEGVNLADAGTPKAEHQFGNEEIVASYGDAPASKTVVGCKYEGYLKKQGGFVKKFNKRYCILKGSILYYYKEKTDNKVEGVVPLRGATFRREGATVFHIITHGGKDCIFEIIVDKKSKDEWIPILETEITNLGGNAGRSQPVLSEEVDPIDSFGTEWVAKKLSGGSVQEYNAAASNLDGILWRMINDKNFTPAGKYFRGREIVQWLVSNENISEDNAIQLGKQLVSYQYIYSSNGVEFGNEGLFLPLIYSDSPAINLNKIWVTPARPALQVLESLYNQTILLIQKFSGCIILELLSSSKDLFDLKLALGELQAVDIDSLSASERISFFINVHNLFILVGQLCLGPAVDLQDRIQLLNLQKLCIGGVQYSASDIMNGILRCNAPAVSSISKKPHFMSKTDPRLKYSLKKSEPLFLFALHPGVTFPFNEVAIKADLESSIKSIAEDYIRKNIQVNDLEIVVSSLLFWHLVDFAKTEKDAFIFLSKFLEPQNQKKLKDLASSGKYIVTARPYPWQSFGIASQFAQQDFFLSLVELIALYLNKRF